jgi:hypothetical protein
MSKYQNSLKKRRTLLKNDAVSGCRYSQVNRHAGTDCIVQLFIYLDAEPFYVVNNDRLQTSHVLVSKRHLEARLIVRNLANADRRQRA